LDWVTVIGKFLSTGSLAALEGFEPQFIFVSAGFDAHAEDDMSSLALRDADFEWVTGCILDIARRHARGRIVSVLEGGYDLDSLGRSVVRHIKVLLG
jgi:acetoin utilization deacetylase AcuC-like enzyme